VKKVEEFSRDKLNNNHSRVDDMVEQIGGKAAVKRIEELAMGAKPKAGKWAHLEGKQAQSTEANLVRQAKGIERDWDAALPDGWRAERDAEKVFSQREGAIDEVAVEERRRRSQKNTAGESKLEGSSPERKESAAHHFVVSGGIREEDIAPNESGRIVGLVEIASATPRYVWKRVNFLRAAWLWVMGHKIRSDKTDGRQALFEKTSGEQADD
jgi:hypothetical protein